MKIYAIGRMSKGAFVAISGALTIRDASRDESAMRLQGLRGLKIAELESVASFRVKDDLKYERVLTKRGKKRVDLGEYVDGEGLIVYAVGLIGVPYIPEADVDYYEDVFFGTEFYPTLRKAWEHRTDEMDARGEEDLGMIYYVREMRVLAWITVGDDMTVTRTPVGPETPLEDEYVRRREPLPPPPEETYDGAAPPLESELDAKVQPRESFWSRLWYGFGALANNLMCPDLPIRPLTRPQAER